MLELLFTILSWGVIVFGLIEKIDEHKSKARPYVVSDFDENAWHNYEFALKIVVFVLCLVSFKVPQSYLVYLPLIGALSLIFSDTVWNLSNGKPWHYCGDGKNEAFENLFTKLSKLFNTDYQKTALIIKFVFVLIGLIIVLL